MCGARETEMEYLVEEVTEKLERMVKETMERAQEIMTTDPDCQPYTKDDIDDKNTTIKMMIGILEMFKETKEVKS
jgi:hypothetical protein